MILFLKQTKAPKKSLVCYTETPPVETPIQVTIRALNLTMDRAPTKPRDKAKELFTIIITIQVVTPKITKFFENSFLFDKVEEYLI